MTSHAKPHDSHAHDYSPHGHKSHGHTIVPTRILVGVFLALLFFTILTVLASYAETWIAHTFDLAIPQWVNVFVALSIAVVKTILVVLYFMQLKYDNPLNSMILIFTMMTVACFLGFTMLDLGNRGTLDRAKAKYIVPGGTGIETPAMLASGVDSKRPITAVARDMAMLPGSRLAKKVQPLHHDDHLHAGSTAQHSRPILTNTIPELGATPAEHHDDHDH